MFVHLVQNGHPKASRGSGKTGKTYTILLYDDYMVLGKGHVNDYSSPKIPEV